MSLFDAYDPSKKAVLNPENVYRPIENFPETVIVTFRRAIVNIALKQNDCEILAYLESGGSLPVYGFTVGEKRFALYQTTMGAPLTVALMEEVIALGGKNFVFFGSCGTLDRTIPPGNLIVPTEAYRDEGTSYHYMAASAGDYVKIQTADETLKIIKAMGLSAVETKVWTTDGLYRETPANMEKRVKDGCKAVDMECSAIMAAAKFRGVKAWQFLYAEDNLDDIEWDPRIMGKVPASASELYLSVAIEIGCNLSGAI